MVRILFIASCLGFSFFASAQDLLKELTLNNEKADWAASYESIVNLTPTANAISLKKWWMEKNRNSPVISYRIDDNGVLVKEAFAKGELNTASWMENYSTQPSDRPANWQLINRKNGEVSRIYDRIINDSCCGCDPSDAFKIKQVVAYAKQRFMITNYLVSPLCLRRNDETAYWYAPGNVSWNTDFAKPSTAKFITSSEVSYPIDISDTVKKFDKLITGETPLPAKLLDDLVNGKLTAFDPETGKVIPKQDVLNSQMQSDTVAVDNGNGVISYAVAVKQLNADDLGLMRILQDWYFDLQTEKLYSEPRSVKIYRKVLGPTGNVRGLVPLFYIPLK